MTKPILTSRKILIDIFFDMPDTNSFESNDLDFSMRRSGKKISRASKQFLFLFELRFIFKFQCNKNEEKWFEITRNNLSQNQIYSQLAYDN